MKKSYYLFNPGKLSRKDNTLKFTPVIEDDTGCLHEDTPRYLPVEGISELFVFGSLIANSALYNFLGQKEIAVHFFDYYENYTHQLPAGSSVLNGIFSIIMKIIPVRLCLRIFFCQGKCCLHKRLIMEIRKNV